MRALRHTIRFGPETIEEGINAVPESDPKRVSRLKTSWRTILLTTATP